MFQLIFETILSCYHICLLYALEKITIINFFYLNRRLQRTQSDYKRGNLLIDSPLYLKLGSSCGGGEWILFSVDRPNVKDFSCGSSLWINWWSSTAPISNEISKRFKELELNKLTERVEFFPGCKCFEAELCWGSSPPLPVASWIPLSGLSSSAILEKIPSPWVPF